LVIEVNKLSDDVSKYNLFSDKMTIYLNMLNPFVKDWI